MRALLLCAALAVQSGAQTVAVSTPAAADLPSEAVREKALADLAREITAKGFFLGIAAADAPRLKLGRAVRVYAVKLEDLARFGAEDSPNRVLKDGGIATSDFTLDGVPQGWIEFRKQDGGWLARWYGGVSLAAGLEDARAGWTEEQKAASFVVFIPGLKVQFAACAEGCALPDPMNPNQEIELKAAFSARARGAFWWRNASALQRRVQERLADGQTRARAVFESLGPEAADALGQ